MTRTLTLTNRHRDHPVNLRLLRRLLTTLLRDLCGLEEWDLGICLLGASRMTQLNETFLRHAGSTDVITFDYAPPARGLARTKTLHGEVFICLDEAIIQARRFRTSWQCELTRYAAHGVLHLLGFDDLRPGPRRLMKREENRCLRLLAEQFDLRQLQPPTGLPKKPTPGAKARSSK